MTILFLCCKKPFVDITLQGCGWHFMAKIWSKMIKEDISYDHIVSLIQQTPSYTSWTDIKAQLYPFE